MAPVATLAGRVASAPDPDAALLEAIETSRAASKRSKLEARLRPRPFSQAEEFDAEWEAMPLPNKGDQFDLAALALPFGCSSGGYPYRPAAPPPPEPCAAWGLTNYNWLDSCTVAPQNQPPADEFIPPGRKALAARIAAEAEAEARAAARALAVQMSFQESMCPHLSEGVRPGGLMPQQGPPSVCEHFLFNASDWIHRAAIHKPQGAPQPRRPISLAALESPGTQSLPHNLLLTRAKTCIPPSTWATFIVRQLQPKGSATLLVASL